MLTSAEWTRYFEVNAKNLLEVPWHRGAELTEEEITAIAKSLQEFQAGESSEGKHLYRYAVDYAERTGDHGYVEALRLFIGEEQRHARDLGRFLQINNIPLVRTTWVDWVFRRLRCLFGGLESSIAVLTIAEVISKVYYPALREATGSSILKRLCDQIISDEEKHVEFQTQQLHKLRENRGWLRQILCMNVQRFLFLGTVLVVWLVHRRVIRRGGLTLRQWWKRCWKEFRLAFSAPVSIQKEIQVEPDPTL